MCDNQATWEIICYTTVSQLIGPLACSFHRSKLHAMTVDRHLITGKKCDKTVSVSYHGPWRYCEY